MLAGIERRDVQDLSGPTRSQATTVVMAYDATGAGRPDGG